MGGRLTGFEDDFDGLDEGAGEPQEDEKCWYFPGERRKPSSSETGSR